MKIRINEDADQVLSAPLGPVEPQHASAEDPYGPELRKYVASKLQGKYAGPNGKEPWKTSRRRLSPPVSKIARIFPEGGKSLRCSDSKIWRAFFLTVHNTAVLLPRFHSPILRAFVS